VKGIEKDTSGNFRLVRLARSSQYTQSMLTVPLSCRWSKTAPYKHSPAPKSGST
jgi:hypothetical protein